MASINVILVAEPGKKRELYLSELQNLDIVVDCVEKASDVFEKCCVKEYSGLLFDFATMIKTHGSNKHQLEELARRFPTVRLNVDPTHSKVVGLFDGQAMIGGNALKLFVERCNEFKPAKIRSSRRIDKIFSVLLFESGEVGEQEGIRANITSISPEGAFITTLHPFKKRDRIWIGIQELEDTSLIQCEVCWLQPWGVEHRLPGVGVSFTEIAETQQKQLEYYLSSVLEGWLG